MQFFKSFFRRSIEDPAHAPTATFPAPTISDRITEQVNAELRATAGAAVAALCVGAAASQPVTDATAAELSDTRNQLHEIIAYSTTVTAERDNALLATERMFAQRYKALLVMQNLYNARQVDDGKGMLDPADIDARTRAYDQAFAVLTAAGVAVEKLDHDGPHL